MNQFQKCQVVMLPTEKASKIHLVPAGESEIINGKLVELKSSRLLFTPTASKYGYPPQHLYILSDDVIKEKDWVIFNHKDEGYTEDWYVIYQISEIDNDKFYTKGSGVPFPIRQAKKIIASTDHELYLPSPSLSFIKKFINKNGSIKEVMVKYILKPISKFALKFLNPIYDYEIDLGLTPKSLQEKNFFQVKIEGEKFSFLPDPDIHGYELGKDIDYVPKINAQNYITVASVQYNFEYETLKNLFRKFETDLHQTRISDVAFENWFENNI